MNWNLKHTAGLGMLFGAVLAVRCANPSESVPVERLAVDDSLVSRLLVDTVRQTTNSADLDFSARIMADEEKVAEVYPLLSGSVIRVPVQLGDKVVKGQVLATLMSGEMAGFDKDAVASHADLLNAERTARQAEDLYDSGLLSAREWEEARNQLLVSQAEQKRVDAVIGLNGGGKGGVYTLKAPLSGFVLDKQVNANMQVRADNSEPLFKVADLSEVWATINVYESDIARIREGDEVSVSVLSYPDHQFKGHIDRIFQELDNESKVMHARVLLSNPGYTLKPGMMATVTVAARHDYDMPVVNSRGLIFDNNGYYVVLLDAGNKPHIREVKLGARSGDKAYIREGLKPGDRIVASRQVFLYDNLKEKEDE